MRHYEKRNPAVVRRLEDCSSSTDKPAEFTGKSDHRICVRLLLAVKSDGMRADQLHQQGHVLPAFNGYVSTIRRDNPLSRDYFILKAFFYTASD